jgi:hypothetical protein
VVEHSSLFLCIVGVRFIEPLSVGLDKSAINLADKSSPYKQGFIEKIRGGTGGLFHWE